MYNHYRSRWCARFWQEAGLDIIPILRWSDARTYEWVFTGIPQHAPVVAVECRSIKSKENQGLYLEGICEGIRQTQPEKLVIYGGADHRTWLEPHLTETEVVWLESWTTVRRRVRLRADKSVK